MNPIIGKLSKCQGLKPIIGLNPMIVFEGTLHRNLGLQPISKDLTAPSKRSFVPSLITFVCMNTYQHFIGIDVSKQVLDFALVENNQIKATFQTDNQPKAILTLPRSLKKQGVVKCLKTRSFV